MRRAPTVAACVLLWMGAVYGARADEPFAGADSSTAEPFARADFSTAEPFARADFSTAELGWRDHLAGELALGVGFDFSRGDFGEPDDTDIAYWPFSVGYTLDELRWTPLDDQFSLRITVPLLRLRAPGDVVVGPDGDLVGSGGGGRDTEFGLGDISTRAAYILYPSADSWLPIAELSSRVKIPTADDSRGLGTGKTDVTVEVDLSRSHSRFVVFAGGGHRFVGGSDFRDSWLASVGAGFQVFDSLSTGLIYDWRESSSNQTPDSHELVPYAMVQLPAGIEFGPYGVAGLSNGSPRWGVGAQIQLRIGLR